MKFYIGSENGSGIETATFEDFVEYLRDMTEQAEQQGEEVFEISVETYLDEDEPTPNLPTEVTVELSELECNLNSEEELNEAVVNFLTDQFGFCIYTCAIDLSDEGLAKVTDIEWDTDCQ